MLCARRAGNPRGRPQDGGASAFRRRPVVGRRVGGAEGGTRVAVPVGSGTGGGWQATGRRSRGWAGGGADGRGGSVGAGTAHPCARPFCGCRARAFGAGLGCAQALFSGSFSLGLEQRCERLRTGGAPVPGARGRGGLGRAQNVLGSRPSERWTWAAGGPLGAERRHRGVERVSEGTGSPAETVAEPWRLSRRVGGACMSRSGLSGPWWQQRWPGPYAEAGRSHSAGRNAVRLPTPWCSSSRRGWQPRVPWAPEPLGP